MLSRTILLATVTLSLLAAAAPADAARQRTRARAGTTARRTVRGTAATLTTPLRNARTLYSASHRAAVAQRQAEMADMVHNGTDGFPAAFAELIAVDGIQQVETQTISYGEGHNRSQRLRVSGIKNGKWVGTLLGTVSVHDIAQLDWKPFWSALAGRVKGDLITISYDYGAGTKRTIIKSKVPSQEATAVPIEVPLNPTPNGITRVLYDRHGKGSNGNADAYVGRVVELQWDGVNRR